MSLEDNLEKIRLIDTYGRLLTDKQFKIMSSYYFENLSLSEIADNLGISRQAVNDTINKSVGLLMGYEDSLHLISREDRVLKKLNILAHDSTDDNLTKKIMEIIDDIRS